MSKKYGLLLRSYAKKACDAEDVAERAMMSVIRGYYHHTNDGADTFEQIVVLVPRDYDCGDTAGIIRKELEKEGLTDRAIVLAPQGHHSCGVLNAGIELLEGEGIERAVIISNKTITALTNQAMNAVSIAFEHGAKVVGVGVDELEEIVRAGRVQNTFAVWDIKALMEVGGFDSDGGVEEIVPSIRLVRKYGQCIAVLVPSETSTLNIRKSPDGEARHKEVMDTKLARQQTEADRLGADLSILTDGLMALYPKTF